jgi:zinc transport system ATP-binding protein
MEKMGISDLKERRVSELSGGQRQRVMIARALVSRPQILILDEPNTGVDTHSQRKFYDLLKELNQDEKITILFITHDLGVIADDVNSVLCINQTLLACHNPHELLSCDEMSKIYGANMHVVCHHH